MFSLTNVCKSRPRVIVATFTGSCRPTNSQILMLHCSNIQQKIAPTNLKGKSKSSQDWLTRQLNDPYVKKARYANYRARSVFKLLEINDKYRILQPGLNVVDCGAAPGSWCQVTVEAVNANAKDSSKSVGCVIGVDLLHIAAIPGATLLAEMDFTTPSTQEAILTHLGERPLHVVLSDMAPNASGVLEMDHDKIVTLVYSAVKFAVQFLCKGGTVLAKVWDGQRTDKLVLDLERFFSRVQRIKPSASRTNSSEFYILAREFKGVAK